jgi:hypothetical protein
LRLGRDYQVIPNIVFFGKFTIVNTKYLSTQHQVKPENPIVLSLNKNFKVGVGEAYQDLDSYDLDELNIELTKTWQKTNTSIYPRVELVISDSHFRLHGIQEYPLELKRTSKA